MRYEGIEVKGISWVEGKLPDVKLCKRKVFNCKRLSDRRKK